MDFPKEELLKKYVSIFFLDTLNNVQYNEFEHCSRRRSYEAR